MQCVPVMTLEEASNMGQIKFSFDKAMEIPFDHVNWTGNNTFFNSSVEYGQWLANESVPLEVSVLPGQLQNASRLQFTWNITEFN